MKKDWLSWSTTVARGMRESLTSQVYPLNVPLVADDKGWRKPVQEFEISDKVLKT